MKRTNCLNPYPTFHCSRTRWDLEKLIVSTVELNPYPKFIRFSVCTLIKTLSLIGTHIGKIFEPYSGLNRLSLTYYCI